MPPAILGFEIGVALLQVIADFVRLDFMRRQNLAYRSLGEFRQRYPPTNRDRLLKLVVKEGLAITCDLHAHHTPKDFSKFMGDRCASQVIYQSSTEWRSTHFRIRLKTSRAGSGLMDEAGVERQVLSPNHPPYLPDEAECVTAVKMLNPETRYGVVDD